MKRVVRNNILLSSIGASLIVMVLFAAPWGIDRDNSLHIWKWIMGVSGLVGMVVITWQVVLGIRIGSWKDRAQEGGLKKINIALGVGTIMALLSHPIAALVVYALPWESLFAVEFASSYDTWISWGKLAFQAMLVGGLLYIISLKLLKRKGVLWLHMLLYPVFWVVWGHAWFTGSMIADIPAIRGYWLLLGAILIGSSLFKMYYEIKKSAHTTSTQNITIVHFSSLTS